MANEFRNLESHSAEYFGETRDHWWNVDFVELIGRRLGFDRVQDVLDVGCGIGHWGSLLARVLPPQARIQGVDRDPLWIREVPRSWRGLSHIGHIDKCTVTELR